MTQESESRHGKPRPGWKRVAMQLPIPLASIWHKEAEVKGVSSVKVMGTMSTAILLGMPEAIRDQLYSEVQRMTWGGSGDVDPDTVWRIFRAMLDAHEKGEPLRVDWAVDRIVDPEVTPARGHKASDREPRAHRTG